MAVPVGSPARAILYAFLANTGIAIAKLAAAIYTASGSMLAEAIHSMADGGNQVLLYIGLKGAEKPADAEHRFGHGKFVRERPEPAVAHCRLQGRFQKKKAAQAPFGQYGNDGPPLAPLGRESDRR